MNSIQHNEWMGRISRSQGLQQTKKKEWENALDLYNCQYFKKMYGEDTERVDVNIANWYIDLLVAMAYFRDPFIFVKAPRSNQYEPFADTMEKTINYHWPELKLKQEFKRVIKSGFIMPPGWMKIGYNAKIGQDVAKKDENEQKSLIKELKNAILGKEEDITRPEDMGVLNLHIKEESVFACWIPSWKILIPEGYQLVDRMPWMVEIEDIPTIDFYSNPFYKNRDIAKPNRLVNESSEGRVLSKVPFNRVSATEDDTICIRLYHIWDRRSNQRFTISSEGTHFEGDWPYDMEGFPYLPMIFEESLPGETKSNPYPVNALEPIMPQIIEYSNGRTMMSKFRRRAAAYILVQKGLLTEPEINQLTENEMMQIIEVSNLQAVQAGVLPQLPPEIFQIDQVIMRDLQMATNMGQMMFQPQSGQRTATQAQIAQGGLQLKANARVDIVEDFTTDLARKMAQLLWQFYSRDQVQEIVGEIITEQMWPKLPDDPKERRRIIQRELQFKIDAGSTAPPKDETVDRKQFLDGMSVAASIAPERLKKDEALKQLFKRFKYIKELDKIVLSNDDEEKKSAEEENGFLDQNMPQVVSPNENHQIHIVINSQGQGTDARALHISEHGRYMGITPQQNQKGDVRPPMKSTNPEMVRQKPPSTGGINQGVQNLGAGTKGQNL